MFPDTKKLLHNILCRTISRYNFQEIGVKGHTNKLFYRYFAVSRHYCVSDVLEIIDLLYFAANQNVEIKKQNFSIQ